MEVVSKYCGSCVKADVCEYTTAIMLEINNLKNACEATVASDNRGDFIDALRKTVGEYCHYYSPTGA